VSHSLTLCADQRHWQIIDDAGAPVLRFAWDQSRGQYMVGTVELGREWGSAKQAAEKLATSMGMPDWAKPKTRRQK
jgi:hypothetical protein